MAELRMQPPGHLSHQHPSRTRDNSTQFLMAQMPPMLPPPPHPHFQSIDLHTQSSKTSEPSGQMSVATTEVLETTAQHLLTENQPRSMSGLSHTKRQPKVRDMLLIQPDSQDAEVHVTSPASESQPPSTFEASHKPFGFLKLDSYLSPTLSHDTKIEMKYSDTKSPPAPPVQMHPAESHQVFTESQVYRRYHTPASTRFPQTEAEDAAQPLDQKTQSDPHQSLTQTLPQRFRLELSTQPFTRPPHTTAVTAPKSQDHSRPLTIPAPTSTTSASPQTQPQSSPTQHPLQHRNPPKTQASVSTTHPTHQTSDASTIHTEIPVVNMSGRAQPNSSQGNPVRSVKAANDTELTEWLKRNTSQSPMTSNDPRLVQSNSGGGFKKQHRPAAGINFSFSALQRDTADSIMAACAGET